MSRLPAIWTVWLCLVSGQPVLAWQDVPYRLPPVDEDIEELAIPPVPALTEEEILDEPLAQARLPPPGAGGERSPLKGSAFWMPAAELTTQAGDLSFVGSGLEFGVPISFSEDGMWIATSSLHRLDIGGSAMLPDSNVVLPDQLWKIQAGTIHMRQLDNGWRIGAMLSVGSASDEPFASIKEMTAMAVGFVNVPSGERNAWNFSLLYAPASQLPFPIPGVAYDWHASDEVQVKIGVPFSVQYRPTEQTTLTATYMPLTNVRLFARQKMGAAWQVYAGYEVTNDTYFLAERINPDDRLYLFDQRLRMGLERKLLLGLNADVSAAYVFDREIFQASSFSSSHYDVVRIESGPLAIFSIFWQR